MLPLSSPGSLRRSHSQPLSQDWALPSVGRRYRPAKALPYELRQHCIIYFEEGLYSQALTLLTNLLVSQNLPASLTSYSQPSPAYVPSPNVLALLSTLIIHPSFTTRSSSDEKLDAANNSLQFLTLVNNLVGPANANLRTAFQHVKTKRSSSHRRSGGYSRASGDLAAARRKSGTTSDGTGPNLSQQSEEDVNDYLQTTFATDGSLWAHAMDFWHIVGWSLNCAVRWKQRWRRWKLLLQLLLQILEDDWTERMIRFRDSRNSGQGSYPDLQSIIKESIAVQFVDDCNGGSGGARIRRMMRALFANGSDKDVAEFNEVFPRETAEKKKNNNFEFRVDRTFNIDEGQFGDYYEPDDEEAIEGYAEDEREELILNRSKPHNAPKLLFGNAAPNPDGIANFGDKEVASSYGGHEAIQLRRRLIILLTKVSDALPSSFIDLSGLFDVLEEYLRPLPLSVYVALITPTMQPTSTKSCQNGERESSSFSPSSHTSLLQELARSLLPPSAPRNPDNFLTQEVLMRNYLPFPASSNSAVDNVKMSLVLESMVLLLKRYVGLDDADGRLRKAVEKGIRERAARVQPSKGKKTDEDEAKEWLKASEARLRLLVQMVESDV